MSKHFPNKVILQAAHSHESNFNFRRYPGLSTRSVLLQVQAELLDSKAVELVTKRQIKCQEES